MRGCLPKSESLFGNSRRGLRRFQAIDVGEALKEGYRLCFQPEKPRRAPRLLAASGLDRIYLPSIAEVQSSFDILTSLFGQKCDLMKARVIIYVSFAETLRGHKSRRVAMLQAHPHAIHFKHILYCGEGQRFSGSIPMPLSQPWTRVPGRVTGVTAQRTVNSGTWAAMRCAAPVLCGVTSISRSGFR